MKFLSDVSFSTFARLAWSPTDALAISLGANYKNDNGSLLLFVDSEIITPLENWRSTSLNLGYVTFIILNLNKTKPCHPIQKSNLTKLIFICTRVLTRSNSFYFIILLSTSPLRSPSSEVWCKRLISCCAPCRKSFRWLCKIICSQDSELSR